MQSDQRGWHARSVTDSSTPRRQRLIRAGGPPDRATRRRPGTVPAAASAACSRPRAASSPTRRPRRSSTSGSRPGAAVSAGAAILSVDAAVPRDVPRNPPPEFRNQVDAAFEEFERAWTDLDVSCCQLQGPGPSQDRSSTPATRAWAHCRSPRGRMCTQVRPPGVHHRTGGVSGPAHGGGCCG